MYPSRVISNAKNSKDRIGIIEIVLCYSDKAIISLSITGRYIF